MLSPEQKREAECAGVKLNRALATEDGIDPVSGYTVEEIRHYCRVEGVPLRPREHTDSEETVGSLLLLGRELPGGLPRTDIKAASLPWVRPGEQLRVLLVRADSAAPRDV